MIPHENAVLELHPQAKEFRPVRGLISGLFGWTFQMPRGGASQHALWYGWVTADGEVSRDTLESRHDAERNLRIYTRTRPVGTVQQPPEGPVEDGK